MSKSVKPRLVSGTRDYLPAEAIARQKMIETIRRVYESFGFLPIETPGLEPLDVLTGNDSSFNMRLFRTTVAQGMEVPDFGRGDPKALRFDLTLSLSRVVASYPEIPKPFKRYEIGRVWRGETPQAGRFCEFMQFDADIIGSRSILADTEIIQLMYEVMRALGFERFVVRINSRKILNGLLSKFPRLTSSQSIEVLRILDKAMFPDDTCNALMRGPENEYDDSAPALSYEEADYITAFVGIEGDGILSQAEDLVGDTALGREGLIELREISENLNALGIPPRELDN